MCGVGDKQRAKQREEHFYCNHNCTHTHPLATNICHYWHCQCMSVTYRKGQNWLFTLSNEGGHGWVCGHETVFYWVPAPWLTTVITTVSGLFTTYLLTNPLTLFLMYWPSPCIYLLRSYVKPSALSSSVNGGTLYACCNGAWIAREHFPFWNTCIIHFFLYFDTGYIPVSWFLKRK
jgi:hypothetical protein